MKDFDNICIGVGIGSLIFGSTIEEVAKILGDPDSEETSESGNLTHFYENLNLSLSYLFEYDLYLGRIATERESLVLKNQTLHGKNINEIKEFIRDRLKAKISEEDRCIHEDGEIQTWIDVDELNISFWFLSGKLYLVDCFCDWIDNDTPHWPEGSTAAKEESQKKGENQGIIESRNLPLTPRGDNSP